MLNIYLALEEVAIRSESYDYNGAYSMLNKIIDTAVNSDLFEDDDIVNDIALMQQLRNNLAPYVDHNEEYDPCEYDPCCYDSCEEEYYDDGEYYEEENVHYGCSSSNGSDSSLPFLAFLMVVLFFNIRKKTLQSN